MYRPTELFIGLRYLRARRRNRFLSFISGISIIGIALGVLSLITVISIMNGFQAELRDRLLGMASHVIISTNSTDFNHQAVRSSAAKLSQVKGIAPYIEGDVMIGRDKNISPAVMRGIDLGKEAEVSNLLKSVVQGDISKLENGKQNLAIGAELAEQLDLFIGDTVSLIIPLSRENSAAIVPRIKAYTVAAIFRADIHRYDSTLIVSSMSNVEELLSNTGADRGERLLLHNMDDAFELQKQFMQDFPDYKVRDWADMHASFFAAIKIEKIAMFAILLLIITVAAFNIVSTMAMGVAEKQSDIAILKTIGASSNRILKIFILQGSTIGILGTGIGAVAGVIIAKNIAGWIAIIENLLGVKAFDPNVFYISEIPSVMYWQDVFLVTAFSLLISIVATVYPALRASNIQPAEALRYE